MVYNLDLRLLSKPAREEIYQIAGITNEERNHLRLRASPVAGFELRDAYKVSREQQKKVHVLIREISAWSGYTPMELEKELTKQKFLDDEVSTLDDSFSLADCSMTLAREYISWLIEFCIINGVPCQEPLYKLAEDIPAYVYACLLSKKCCICGKKAELHHFDAVGAGQNRKEICHIGMRCLPLCRHHHNEIHRIGRETFCKAYIIKPVRIDERIAKAYKL